MNQDKLFEQYYIEFGEFPPIITTTNGDNEKYLKIIQDAIANETPISEEQIEAIYNNNYDLVTENEPKGEETDMEEEKIRTLLAKYGAKDNEIENFMQDLMAEKHDNDTEEDDDDYILSKDVIDKLKLTREGKQLIINAPAMAKEELEKAIKQLLDNK